MQLGALVPDDPAGGAVRIRTRVRQRRLAKHAAVAD
jgi:hypothetical protein